MKIMFSHYDEVARTVAVHVEGMASPIYLGPIEDKLVQSVMAEGGEDAIAREFLSQEEWVETLSSRAGVNLTDAERAIFSYQQAVPEVTPR